MEATGWRPGIEKELICSTRVSIACAKGKSPQAGNADYLIILIPQLSLKMTGNSVKREDFTAPKLANQNAMAEAAEIGWRLNQTPRSIKRGTVFQALQQLGERVAHAKMKARDRRCEKNEMRRLRFVIATLF
jgi:hypothetical protein